MNNVETIAKFVEERAFYLGNLLEDNYQELAEKVKKEIKPKEEALFKKLDELGYENPENFSLNVKSWSSSLQGTEYEDGHVKTLIKEEFNNDEDMTPDDAWEVLELAEAVNQVILDNEYDLAYPKFECESHVDNLIHHYLIDCVEGVDLGKPELGYYSSRDIPDNHTGLSGSFMQDFRENCFDEHEDEFIEAYKKDQAEAKAEDRWSKAPSKQQPEEDDTQEVKKTNRFKR